MESCTEDVISVVYNVPFQQMAVRGISVGENQNVIVVLGRMGLVALCVLICPCVGATRYICICIYGIVVAVKHRQ